MIKEQEGKGGERVIGKRGKGGGWQGMEGRGEDGREWREGGRVSMNGGKGGREWREEEKGAGNGRKIGRVGRIAYFDFYSRDSGQSFLSSSTAVQVKN